MSSAHGFPDWQRITEWLGTIIASATGLAIGAGTHTDGPFPLSSWAAVVVAVKPTGGNVTVTLSQAVPGGPPSLVDTPSQVVQAGQVQFLSFVLLGGNVSLTLQGSAPGTTVDYAMFPTNTVLGSIVSGETILNVQHNDIAAASEPTLDFEDNGPVVWTITDDVPNTRVKVTAGREPSVIAGAPGGPLLKDDVATLQGQHGIFDVLQAIRFPNGPAVQIKDAGGVARTVVSMDGLNNLLLGTGGGLAAVLLSLGVPVSVVSAAGGNVLTIDPNYSGVGLAGITWHNNAGTLLGRIRVDAGSLYAGQGAGDQLALPSDGTVKVADLTAHRHPWNGTQRHVDQNVVSTGSIAWGGFGDVSITYQDPFAFNPIVDATTTNGGAGYPAIVGIQALSTTGATLRVCNMVAGGIAQSFDVHWLADGRD